MSEPGEQRARGEQPYSHSSARLDVRKDPAPSAKEEKGADPRYQNEMGILLLPETELHQRAQRRPEGHQS